MTGFNRYGPLTPRVYKTSTKAAAAPPVQRQPAAASDVQAAATIKIDGRRRRGDYTPAQIAQAAFLAGRGASAKEIADTLETTPVRVYGLCHRVGVTLTPKGQSYVSIVVPVDRTAMQAIERAAIEHDVDPAALAGRLLREIIDAPDLLRSLAVDAAHALRGG